MSYMKIKILNGLLDKVLDGYAFEYYQHNYSTWMVYMPLNIISITIQLGWLCL
jgi:hypothetical protein